MLQTNVTFVNKYKKSKKDTEAECFIIREGGATKSDEFSEKLQTAFDRLPPLIFGKLCCNLLW